MPIRIYFLGLVLFSNSVCFAQLNQGYKSTQQPFYIGVWVKVASIWDPGKLIINADSTFTFHDEGCYGQRYTKGKWKIKNKNLVLCSYGSFKQIANTKIVNVHDSTAAVKLYWPGPDDTVNIYIDEARFRLKNDTLYWYEGDKKLKGCRLFIAK